MGAPKRQPPVRDLAPVAARYRVRYRKAGRMKFSSARDFQRALERALRRAGAPIAFSAGFSPHPRISYTNTVQTGVASEAEYFELGLTREVAPLELAHALSAGLPAGFAVVEVVQAGSPDFAARLQASEWEFRLQGLDAPTCAQAVEAFLGLAAAPVERLTKSGPTTVDVRGAVSFIGPVRSAESVAPGTTCAILQMVVRHVTPSVRPVDVLTALQRSAGLPQPQATMICRLAQGPLSEDGATVGDPFEPDRQAASRA